MSTISLYDRLGKTMWGHKGYSMDIRDAIKDAKERGCALDISNVWMNDDSIHDIELAMADGLEVVDRTNNRRKSLIERNKRVIRNPIREDDSRYWSLDFNPGEVDYSDFLLAVSPKLPEKIIVRPSSINNRKRVCMLVLLIMANPDHEWDLQFVSSKIVEVFSEINEVINSEITDKVHYFMPGSNIVTLTYDEDKGWVDEFGYVRFGYDLLDSRCIPYEFGEEELLVSTLSGERKSEYWNNVLHYISTELQGNEITSITSSKSNKLLEVLGIE
jgi:hypothetical protein